MFSSPYSLHSSSIEYTQVGLSSIYIKILIDCGKISFKGSNCIFFCWNYWENRNYCSYDYLQIQYCRLKRSLFKCNLLMHSIQVVFILKIKFRFFGFFNFYFVLERFNTKWVCKVAPEKRLTDEDIKEFVLSVKPIAFHVLYNSYEDEARYVLQINSISCTVQQLRGWCKVCTSNQ